LIISMQPVTLRFILASMKVKYDNMFYASQQQQVKSATLSARITLFFVLFTVYFNFYFILLDGMDYCFS
jgi:hypothetical protein